MGVANVIPGVSGGTVAFITGIYERLINALKSIDLQSLKLLFSGDVREFSKRISLNFLATLFLGVFVGILSLAKLLELAFEYYEVCTLAFFFGLILASIVAVTKQVDAFTVGTAVSFLIGTAIAISMAFLPPAQPNGSFIYLVLCGVAAVASMILPGLSGSYILLLMGNYSLVLRAVSSFDFSILIPMVAGCVIGLIALSRLLSYFFQNLKNQTIGVLAGFVAGSLLIIWPWKTSLTASFDGKEKTIGYTWNLPEIDAQLLVASFLMLLGFTLVFWMEKHANKR